MSVIFRECCYGATIAAVCRSLNVYLFICVFGYTLAMNYAEEWKHMESIARGYTHTPKTTHTQ